MRTLLICLMTTLAWADTSAPQDAKAKVLATLQRTMCLGTCPVYKLTIYNDGRVEWEGSHYVKVKVCY